MTIRLRTWWALHSLPRCPGCRALLAPGAVTHPTSLGEACSEECSADVWSTSQW